MHTLAKLALAASFAAFALAASPSFADEIKTNTMAPMKADQMSTDAMSASPMAADPMKADCMKKAEAETDAAKKQAMAAACDATAGGMMKAEPAAPQQ